MKKMTDLDAFERSTDYSNYFCSYGYLYHQKEMLEDTVRMDSYRTAILGNASCFEDKVVLDVGSGSGILAIWAAQAGARKVYAVESTSMAKFARQLVEANGLADKVEVIQCLAEDLELPEQVDLIVSEWMGYMLLRESMFDSVIKARDRWLKPGGALYPSHARLLMVPYKTPIRAKKVHEYRNTMDEWSSFAKTMKERHGVCVDTLTQSFNEEHQLYFMRTAQYTNAHASQVMGPPIQLYEFNCATVRVEELSQLRVDFSSTRQGQAVFDAFCGYFDVDFKGCPSDPAPVPVTLSTAPAGSEEANTHWGQQLFFMPQEVKLKGSDRLEGNVEITRQEINHRLLHLRLTCRVVSGNSSTPIVDNVVYNID
mmetsp:Transcript_2034/g.4594  ORF Transcript_2034/g.4594 Transcript_2034/m.4594 type:complete len:369 (-) Transcript_2034:88-1194(-)